MICLVKVLFYDLWDGKKSLECEHCPIQCGERKES